MFRFRVKWILLSGWISLLSWQSELWALSTDRQQPLTIEADTATIDNAKGTATYQGNVIIRQGSIEITADSVVIYYSEKQDIQKVIAQGNPAHFKQTPDKGKEDLHAKAKVMEYFADQDMLNLSQDAELWQGKDTFAGQRITYDTQRGIIKADKGDSKDGRIVVTLQPRQSQPEPTPPPQPVKDKKPR